MASRRALCTGRSWSLAAGHRALVLRAALLIAACCWCLGAPAVARAEVNDKAPAVHRIYPGHTLGKLAKRYHVSIDAICHANGIQRSHALQPGDQLVIPARSDEDGSQAKAQRETLLAGGKPKAAAPARQNAKVESPDSKPARRKAGDPKLHTVYQGQTLGMIAKRYRVSIAAITQANAMSRTDTIRPGERLVIPAPADTDGSQARAARARLLGNDAPSAGASNAGAKPTPKKSTAPKTSTAPKPKVHVVAKGHTLGKIASRYRVNVEALCRANDIRKSDPLQLHQELVIPTKGDPDGSKARSWRRREMRAHATGKGGDQSWRDYKKQAWKRGYITLESPNGDKRWTGYVIGPGNRLLPLAREKVTDVLASWRTGKTKTIDSRLVKLIAQVSDVFGGRRIRVVSGYREHSHSTNSRHPEGQALDFSIPGVPNWALRDYLRTLPGVGVGFYPNSSFVHIDVREKSTYWVDTSGPGEAPRYVHKSYGNTGE